MPAFFGSAQSDTSQRRDWKWQALPIRARQNTQPLCTEAELLLRTGRIIENEFGEVGIDDSLIEAGPLATQDMHYNQQHLAGY